MVLPEDYKNPESFLLEPVYKRIKRALRHDPTQITGETINTAPVMTLITQFAEVRSTHWQPFITWQQWGCRRFLLEFRIFNRTGLSLYLG